MRSDSPYLSFYSQQKHSDRIKITPDMNIQPILHISHTNLFAVTDQADHYPDDLFILNIIFRKGIIIPCYDVAVGKHTKDPVKNISILSFV